MSCIQRIKSFPNYTKTETKISEYIMNHLPSVIHDTAQSLATKTDTSAAAVIRFSKNLGYRGFTDFKVALATEVKDELQDDIFSERIENNDSLDTIIKKARTSDMNVIQQTYALINKKDMDLAIEKLRHAKTVYLVGIGSSAICCLDLYQKLLRIQVNVIFDTDFHVQLTSMAYLTKEDLVIGISYSGETHEVVTAMRFAKEKQAATIAITQMTKNTLHKIAGICLPVPTTEKDLRLGAVTSRNASLILTDLMYIGLIRKGLDTYKKRLKNTRKAVKLLTGDR